MKKIYISIMLMLGANAQATDWVTYCGEIDNIRTWSNGSDAYGIQFGYKTNHSNCSSGFYVVHEAANKNYVFSQILAAKSTKDLVCVQTTLTRNIGNRCQLNSIETKD